MKKVTIRVDPFVAMRRHGREQAVAAMRDGLHVRATTFKSKKAYVRKPKHRNP